MQLNFTFIYNHNSPIIGYLCVNYTELAKGLHYSGIKEVIQRGGLRISRREEEIRKPIRAI